MQDLSKILEDRMTLAVGQLNRKGDKENHHVLKYNAGRGKLSQDKPNQTLNT